MRPPTNVAASPPGLAKALKLRDLILFNIVAVLSLRWLATSAATGPSALTLWVLAALLFFLPLSVAVGYLSSRFPKEGGLYFWTKRAFGDGHGFLCGWCYWVNNILYPANLLMSTAVIATYVVGRGESGLGERWSYVLVATMTALWLAIILNVVGVGTGKWLENIGGIAAAVPGLLLIGIAVLVATRQPPANSVTFEQLTPNLRNFAQVNLWASIAFAFSGIELSSTMADEVTDSRRNLPRSLLLSVPVIASLYIIGTGAVLWLVPSGDINIVSGFLQATAAGAGSLGEGFVWIAAVAAALYVLGNIGGVGAWLAGPARVAFAIGIDRYLPPAFGRIHPRWKTPHVAILTQGVLASIFLILSVLGEGTTVEKAYLILLDTMILLYFIPYVYLFLSYLLFRRREANERGVGLPLVSPLIGISGLLLTLFAMTVAVIPPPGDTDPLLFELKVLGGTGGFILFGGILYWRARWKGTPHGHGA